MRSFRRLLFLLALLLLIGPLRAQVQCHFHGLRDTLSKEMLSNLRIANFTGVEIHNVLDARVYDGRGRTVYRYYVPKMVNEAGSGTWSLRPGESDFFHKKSGYKKGRVVSDQLNLPAFTGDLRLTLTLRHPLDTQSIVCRTELLLPVNGGVIDYDRVTNEKIRKATGYFDGLAAKFPEFTDRFTPALLQGLRLNNASGHTICDEVKLTVTQRSGFQSFYELQLGTICVPPGEHRLTPAQIAAATVVDRYDSRDTLQPLLIRAHLTGRGGSTGTEVPTKLHGATALPVKHHYNAALNMALDFPLPQEEFTRPLSPAWFTAVEDSNGRMITLQVPGRNAMDGPDLRPASPFGEALLSRQAGGALMCGVFRADDFTNEEIITHLTEYPAAISAHFVVEKHGPFEIIFLPAPTQGSEPEARGGPGLWFFIRYHDLLYRFVLGPFGSGGDTDFSFDMAGIANSIEINGYRLQFSFAGADEWLPTAVTVVPGDKTTTLPKTEYLDRLKTFLLYAEESDGKHRTDTNFKEEDKGTERLATLLAMPYAASRLDAVEYPTLNRQIIGKNGRFRFQDYTEASLGVSFGVPEGVSPAEFDTWRVGRTIGIDGEGNLTKKGSGGSSRTMGEVKEETSLSGRGTRFYGSFHVEKGLSGFAFTLVKYEEKVLLEQFYPAVTVQDHAFDHNIGEVSRHANGGHDIYRASRAGGFLYNGSNPGMSLLFTGMDNLYQITVSGINEAEMLAWLRTVKMEGKSLKIEPQSGERYDVWLE